MEDDIPEMIYVDGKDYKLEPEAENCCDCCAGCAVQDNFDLCSALATKVCCGEHMVIFKEIKS